MKKFKLILLGVLFFNFTSFSQENNRISLQTGLFHCFFDQTPIVNEVQNPFKKTASNLFGGILLDSKGIQYQRKLSENSTFSMEYMSLSAAYEPGQGKTLEIDPILTTRNIKTININYSRKLNLSNKLFFIYGGGLNYLWGHETIYHYTLLNGWGEPRFYGYNRNDFGLNVRIGIEYSPLKWLTLYTNFDFLGIVYLGAKDTDGNNAQDYYKEKYGLTNIPSRFDLSWRFGIGFNFGK